MCSRARPKEVGQCSYRVAKQLRPGLPREFIHTLFTHSTANARMSGSIVRYDGGAVAPRTRPQPTGARATTGTAAGSGDRRATGANNAQAAYRARRLETGACVERCLALQAPRLPCRGPMSLGCCKRSCIPRCRAPRGGSTMSLLAAAQACAPIALAISCNHAQAARSCSSSA